jgi:hypothetical protein
MRFHKLVKNEIRNVARAFLSGSQSVSGGAPAHHKCPEKSTPLKTFVTYAIKVLCCASEFPTDWEVVFEKAAREAVHATVGDITHGFIMPPIFAVVLTN